MSYFSNNYDCLRFPVAENGKTGLRQAQLGAIFAIGSYFTLPNSIIPGIVVMPTGSGKTAVICLSPFLLRAERVLVLTPSQLVRAQIAEQLTMLTVLKKVGVLPEDCVGPKVKEVKGRVTSIDAWNNFKNFDFVVATPQCVSPGIKGIVEPPENLFDLILIDEAHHSEAPRWSDILKYFQKSKRLLFTATPFRRDKKELKGNFIYNYSLRQAHIDKIFGNLSFIPVEPSEGVDHDRAIAERAEEIYNEDASKEFNHRLMVRTDSKKRAEYLAEIYRQYTKLQLEVIHSGHSLRTIRKTLTRLKNAEIHGVICVAMMGEGFDFPELKIAAIHAPHKSLAVTLQFIGRFARTSGERLGEAKFIAIPQDIQAETNELYRQSATWQEIVSNLNAARVEKEVKSKEISSSFLLGTTENIDEVDVELTSFKTYFHVKIYRLEQVPNLRSRPDLGENFTILRHEVSDEFNSSIILIKQITQPRWTDIEDFSKTEYDLVVLYFDPSSNLLFINSSKRTLEFYRLIEDHYGAGTATLISGPQINRVLSDLRNPDFFSIGLKNSVQNSNTESYQIKTGPSAQNALSPTDGRLYKRGHVFGKGTNAEGSNITIGYSSSSKVWSNHVGRISELVSWCQKLAVQLQKKDPVLTGTPLDILDVGTEINSLPDGLIGVGWSSDVFKKLPRINIFHENEWVNSELLEIDLNINFAASTTNSWVIDVNHRILEGKATLHFGFKNERVHFEWVGKDPKINVIINDEEVEFVNYLNHYPLAFYLEDFSRVDGATLYSNRQDPVALASKYLKNLNWVEGGIDITNECSTKLNLPTPRSIHDFLGKQLIESEDQIIFYDHGTGEIADYITFNKVEKDMLKVCLFHCKKSGDSKPGNRVNDVYEVCGQVVKCLIWLKSREELLHQVLERHQKGSVIIKGSRNDILNILSDDTLRKMEIAIYIVQPGISTSVIESKISHILGSASDYIKRTCGAQMFLIGSP